MKGSIPDGAIIQRSFKALIETKVEAEVNVDQLRRHADGFSDESQKILLLLTKTALGSEADAIGRALAAATPGSSSRRRPLKVSPARSRVSSRTMKKR